eukprot:1699397-Amphidinium_carterae.2
MVNKSSRLPKRWSAIALVPCVVAIHRTDFWQKLRLANFLSNFSKVAKNLPLPEDVTWALYQESKAMKAGKQACGDQCEDCYHLWSTNFAHMSWGEMIEKADRDKDFKTQVNTAKAIKQGKQNKTFQESEVKGNIMMGVEIETPFLVASERDMRRMTGMARIPRMALKGIPSVTVLAHLPGGEEKGEEVLYCFKSEESVLRRATVKIFMGQNMISTRLSTQDCLTPESGTNMHTHALTSLSTESGFLDVVKSQGSLLDFQGFLDNRLFKKKDGDDDDDDDNDKGNEGEGDHEEQTTLVGAAAASMQPVKATPPSNKKLGKPPHPLERLGSSNVLGTGGTT